MTTTILLEDEVKNIEREASTLVQFGFDEIDWLKEGDKLSEYHSDLKHFQKRISSLLKSPQYKPFTGRLHTQKNRIKNKIKDVKKNLARFE